MAMEKITEIISRYPEPRASVLQILQDIQNEYNFLPRTTLDYLAQNLRVPLSVIYSLATFYSAFSLKPRGKYHITICLGTACHCLGCCAIGPIVVCNGKYHGEFKLRDVAALIGACP